MRKTQRIREIFTNLANFCTGFELFEIQTLFTKYFRLNYICKNSELFVTCIFFFFFNTRNLLNILLKHSCLGFNQEKNGV